MPLDKDLLEHAMNGAPPAEEPVTDFKHEEFEHLGENVVRLNNVTKLDLPVISVLQMAKDADLKEIVICGVDKEGCDFFGCSVADGGAVLWHLERGKYRLMKIVDEGTEDGKPPVFRA